jgi:hypothetical protein
MGLLSHINLRREPWEKAIRLLDSSSKKSLQHTFITASRRNGFGNAGSGKEEDEGKIYKKGTRISYRIEMAKGSFYLLQERHLARGTSGLEGNKKRCLVLPLSSFSTFAAFQCGTQHGTVAHC